MRLLEDRDGDGFYETSHIFAEGLPWPTGIACWDGGVYVTAAPDIWYFKDTNGDGKADIRRKVYTGFVVYNVQALVNGLQWGVDNRIYGVTAANGGTIRPADQPGCLPSMMVTLYGEESSRSASPIVIMTAILGTWTSRWFR